MADLKTVDPEIFDAIQQETYRETDTLELIASENCTSGAVREAVGSVMTNKYAEGYPFRRRKDGTINWEGNGRYYGGCEHVNVAERLAIHRAKELFGAEHANVQPHSGSQANMAVYFALLDVGDTYFGLELSHGGHLTHGHPISFSGMFYNVIHYGVDQKTEVIDYDVLAKMALEHKPKLIVTGASAYPRTLDFARFREIADSVGAYLMVDMAHIAGLIAAGLHPSPVPHADVVTTTTHKTLRGPRGGMVLMKDKVAAAGGRGHRQDGVPRDSGRAAHARYRGQGRLFQGSARPGFQGVPAEDPRERADGTDTHLMLVDLRERDVTGKAAENGLEKAGITINKNTIPFDPQKPFIASGIRVGTPALTTRGMGKDEIEKIVALIDRALSDIENEQVLNDVKAEVGELCAAFPLVVGEDRPV